MLGDEVERDEHPKTVHDVGALAEDLQEVDSLGQALIFDYVCNVPDDRDGFEAYESLDEAKVTVNDLRNIYLTRNESKAISLLHTRQKLEIEREYIACMDDSNFALSSDTTYLDFILVVGDRVGIDVFLSNVAVNGDYFLTLKFNLHMKEFWAKHGNLGFDPTGAMLCIGSTDCLSPLDCHGAKG